MSEELLQRDLLKNPPKIGDWYFYNIGTTNLNSLKYNGIIPNIDYGKLGKKKPDGLIALNQSVVAVIENKATHEFNTKAKRRNAIKQELDVAKALGATILIVTDSVNTVWINPGTGENILDERGEPLSVVFDPINESSVKLIKRLLETINESNSQIVPISRKDPTPLSKQIWQDIWSISGATPENCLYTFVELFIFKYLSDLNVLTGFHNFYHLLDMYKTNTEEDVLDYYANLIRKEIKNKFKKNPIDNTTIINGTIFVSKDEKAVKGYSSVFRKILERFNKEGKLENIDHDFKSKLFESFLKQSISKKNWGQYFTPLRVVKAMVRMTDIKEGMIICDPACGVGKFLLEPILKELKRFFPITNNHLDQKITLVGFDKGFDHDEQKTIILAKANMLIYFSDLIKENPGITEQFSDLFNRSFILKTNSVLGTLSDPRKEKFDVIFTNPPYVTSGSSNLKEEIRKSGLTSYFTINSLGVEGLFLEWIIRALKRGGKAFIVVPDGIFNRKYDKDLRQFILKECIIDAVISLPLKTFFTTNKKTYILALTKKTDASFKQDEPVFTYLVSEIGETLDINRFETEENHLEIAVNLYNQFKGSKIHFQTLDTRCKTIEINRVHNDCESGWLIDGWWTKEEKIELGIIEKEEFISIEDYAMLIGDASTSLEVYRAQLAELSGKKKSEVSLEQRKIKNLFDCKLGNPRYTKKFINEHRGSHPVYSANNAEPLGYVDFYDYEKDSITWARNGFAGFLTIHTGRFSINYDRGILIPKDEHLYLPYVKMILEPILRSIAVGRKGPDGEDEFTKVYLSTIEEIDIPMPVDVDGKVSLEAQKAIWDDLQVQREVQAEIKLLSAKINELKIDISNEIAQKKELRLGKIFDIRKGSAVYTKAYIKKYPGIYPVFSSQTTGNGVIGTINKYDHDQKCLTWTTDGVNAGTVFLRNEKFSMTTHCGALFLEDEFKDIIDLEYLFFFLNGTLKKTAYGEQNKRVTKTIIERIMVPLPVDESGEIDLAEQKQIVKNLTIIAHIQNEIDGQFKKIVEANITP